MSNKIIFVLGCTGTGKSDYALKLAKDINAEIINADIMQCYKGLGIGTNKLINTQGIKHHMLDMIDPLDNINIIEFVDTVTYLINKIIEKNKIAIIVGGSNYYINSLIWKNNLIGGGKNYSSNISDNDLYDYLKQIDPDILKKYHRNDIRRLRRSAEIYNEFNIPHSKILKLQKQEFRFSDFEIHLLSTNISDLYKKLNNRVDIMINQGLVTEAYTFYKKYKNNIDTIVLSKSIGFKELIPYFKEDISLDLAIDKIKQNTRNYAKRQNTWLKNKFLNKIDNIKIIHI